MLGNLTRTWRETIEIYARLEARNARWFALQKSGGGTVREMMEADFGPGGPKGIEIAAPLSEDHIAIGTFAQKRHADQKSFWNWNEDYKSLGIASAHNQFWLNEKKFEFLPRNAAALRGLVFKHRFPVFDTTTHSHEFLHTRQSDARESGWQMGTDGNIIESLRKKTLPERFLPGSLARLFEAKEIREGR